MQVRVLLVAAVAVVVPVFSGDAGDGSSSPLPTVMLDYSTVQAVGGNTTVGYYKYQNIRYAKAPTGDLRFAAPKWPDVETEINTGNFADTDVDCASSEDCLFLDVWAPCDAFGRNLPVLVYNYGGRFMLGSKSVNTPEGIFELSTDFIYVAYNYRLGITGVATGPTYQHEGGVSNLCVWDATHAFEWVQKYIGSFGGNPDDVTAVGFSAGGSQIAFQMTRFAGNAPQLFHKAYIISPGYLPSTGHYQAEKFWQNVSSAVGCAGGHLDCMRSVEFSRLANATTSMVSAYSYTLQPRVDGFILPDTYEASVYQGHFNFSGPCVLTHEQHEFNTVAYDGVDGEEDISPTLRGIFPAIAEDAIEERKATRVPACALMTCGNLTSPAKHGTDQSYYFYSTYSLSTSSNETTSTSYDAAEAALVGAITSPVNATIAVMMQKYLLSFVLTGNPNTMWADDKIYWPQYNESSVGAQIVSNDTFTTTGDSLANAKSLYWNKALWH
ncbi:hypothetical protein PRIC1_012282 [Phytophthora ramorum]